MNFIDIPLHFLPTTWKIKLLFHAFRKCSLCSEWAVASIPTEARHLCRKTWFGSRSVGDFHYQSFNLKPLIKQAVWQISIRFENTQPSHHRVGMCYGWNPSINFNRCCALQRILHYMNILLVFSSVPLYALRSHYGWTTQNWFFLKDMLVLVPGATEH